MEIERKFLIEAFPTQLKEVERAQVWQGYLSTDPVVRIRKKQTENKVSYKLCFKGEGRLVRQEVELPLEEEVYLQLQDMLKKPMIYKDYRVYEYENYRLECSKVSGGEEEFLYAEIEFETEPEALAFKAPPFLQNDVTEKEGYTMGEYWERMKENE